MLTRGMVVAGALIGALAQACGGAQPCTLIGAIEGLNVTVPAALWVRSGTLAVEVCRPQQCASTTRALEAYPPGTPTPSDRLVTASFADLGRRFAPGPVRVTLTLRGPGGALVATRTQTADLTRSYPNGQACDGAGYVGASVTMRAADRR